MKVSDIILIILVIWVLVGFLMVNDNMIGPAMIGLLFVLFAKLILKSMERGNDAENN